MVTYAFFPGCKIPYHLPAYGQATRALCRVLGIGLEDVEFSCCGYPVRHQSLEASFHSAARNLSLAARAGLPILTPCKCCFGNLRHAMHRLDAHVRLREAVAGLLAREGLDLRLDVEVVHLMTALDRDVGRDRLRDAVARPLLGLRVAAHYGCHALRPANVTRFDNPLHPTVFERLLEATGAECVEWSTRLECCGHPLRGRNDQLSGRLARRKLADAAQAGAQVVCAACTYCQMQFDDLPDQETRGAEQWPPSILLPQLLGLALGIEPETLGLADLPSWAGE